MSVSLRELAKELTEFLNDDIFIYGNTDDDGLWIAECLEKSILPALIGKCRSKVTPEQLHAWYLEAVSKLNKECYNAKANVPYVKLTEQQQYIDKYIADKINATPTFSGEKDTAKHCEICKFEGNCNVQETYTKTCFSFKPKDNMYKDCKPLVNCGKQQPTEQKEYCSCGYPIDDDEQKNCGLCKKPIPAEKKELTIEQKIILAQCRQLWCDRCKCLVNCNIGETICNVCGETFRVYKSEPKPKDRIEEIDIHKNFTEDKVELRVMINKINELIRHINEES